MSRRIAAWLSAVALAIIGFGIMMMMTGGLMWTLFGPAIALAVARVGGAETLIGGFLWLLLTWSGFNDLPPWKAFRDE